MLELPHALTREAGGLAQVGARWPPLAPVVQVVKLPPEVVHLRTSNHRSAYQLHGPAWIHICGVTHSVELQDKSWRARTAEGYM